MVAHSAIESEIRPVGVMVEWPPETDDLPEIPEGGHLATEHQNGCTNTRLSTPNTSQRSRGIQAGRES
jgi:hypothetical protein